MHGVQGAVFQLLNFGIVAGGLFLITGFLHHRIGSTDIIGLGGVAKSMSLLVAFFFFFGLASMRVPGTNGFPAEFLLIVSALSTHTGAGLAALFTIVVGAGYFLGIYRQAFLGPVRHAVISEAVGLRSRELALVLVLAGLILLLGLWPSSVLDIIRVASEAWVGHLK